MNCQSDTFAEGERPESPVAVGERLSREHSPILEEEYGEGPQAIEPGTPDQGQLFTYDKLKVPIIFKDIYFYFTI